MEVDTSAEGNTILNDIATDAKPLVSERARDIHTDPFDEQTAECKNCDSNTQENFSDPPSNFSKRQLKKQRKLQKRLKMQSEWKLQRKLKNKERKLRHKMLSVNLEKPKITPMASSSRKFTVVIDFSYDELMSHKDLIKCGNQVIRCYSANRRSTNPLQLHFCNFTGKIEAEIGKNNGYKKWDIHFHEDTYLEVFNKSDLVYLTSESRNVLETLEEDKVYIIGGLVDHNAHKGVSYQKAVYEGISHAQLPIKKYIQMKSRSVLTINHVFEILLKISNGEPWSKTLRDIVPPRMFENQLVEKKKRDSPKTSEDEDDDEENTENDNENESIPETTMDVSTTN